MSFKQQKQITVPMVYHCIIASLQHLQYLNLESHLSRVPCYLFCNYYNSVIFNKDSRNTQSIYLHPAPYKYKRRLCSQRAEKRTKGQKMDTNDHVVADLQSCLLHGLMLAFLLLKQTNGKRRKGIYACQNAYGSRIIKDRADKEGSTISPR